MLYFFYSIIYENIKHHLPLLLSFLLCTAGDLSLVIKETAPHPTSSFVVAVFELGHA
jgi:hypothetical protein